MFDAHNHLDRCPDPAGALAQARRTGIRGQVLAGVDVAGWRQQAAVARDAPDLWCAFGIHPWTAGSTSEEHHGELVEQLVRALDGALGVRPCALGELGLDEARRRGPAERNRQRALFRAQLALARERDLPVVLHVVRAHGAALRILRRDGLPAAGGVVHSASTPPDLVPSYLDLGLHLSFGPALTRHARARAAAALVPRNRLLAETDAPDQAPAGETSPSSPSCLPRVVAALAEVQGVPTEVMADATAAAARRLYRLPAD